jgi:hypothetical protein
MARKYRKRRKAKDCTAIWLSARKDVKWLASYTRWIWRRKFPGTPHPADEIRKLAVNSR